MSFIRDVTIGEGESVQPNTSFVKTWRIQNNGKINMMREITSCTCNCRDLKKLRLCKRTSIPVSRSSSQHKGSKMIEITARVEAQKGKN